MSYSEKLMACLSEYEKMTEQLDRVLESQRYQDAVMQAPFVFIKAIHICELLEAFNNCAEKRPYMRFGSAAEAEATYTDIIRFKDKKDEVLDLADAVVGAGKIVDEINSFVEKNPHLPNSLIMQNNENLFYFASETLEKVQGYNQLLTKGFRDKFTESCIESLPVNELDELVLKGIIRDAHMDNIKKEGSESYKARFKHLCVNVFGREDVLLGSYKQSLKGVTFSNETENRQDLLKKMDDAVKKGEPILIQAIPETYTPPLGNPEPSVRINWNNQTIGFLPKESAKQIAEMSNRPIRLEAKVEKLVGGGNVAYGCVVDLEVREMIKATDLQKQTEHHDVGR